MFLERDVMNIIRVSLIAMTGLAVALPVYSQELSPADLQAALEELRELKAIQQETSERINALENALAGSTSVAAISTAESPELLVDSSSTVMAAAAPTEDLFGDRLDFTGDMLFRFEGNYSDGPSVDRERGVMRARIGATYKVDDRLTVGGLLETGDPDDPNSGYLTFDEFADDFEISLSRAYASYDFGAATVFGGKFPKPFKSTDLIWDGDVNPAGVGLQSGWDLSDNSRLETSGIFFVIDEDSGGADSHMLGGQVAFSIAPSDAFGLMFAAGYYDYELGSVNGAGSGDFLNNLRAVNGDYLSDYDLIDLLLTAKWSGISERWPISLSLDYVQNRGAAVAADEAIGLDLAFGRSSQPHDWSLSYGYGETGVDAVLGAFSHDNYAISTNYMSHEFGLAYVLSENLKMTGALYHYKPLDSLYLGTGMTNDWLNRLRLNIALSY